MRKLSQLFCVAATLLITTLIAPQLSFAQRKLCVMNADGSGLRTLSEMPGYIWEGSPSWSPDGKLIAFDGTNSNFPNDHIFVKNADGAGEARDIGLGSQPSWSDDGKQLCFFMMATNPVNEKVGIWVMNADGSSRQFVTTGGSGRWARDGARIAYIDTYEKGATVWIYNILDAEAKPVIKEDFASITPVTWSPDSKQLSFVARRVPNGNPELYICNAEGDPKLTSKASEQLSSVPPYWSHDKILFGLTGGPGGARPTWLDLTKDEAPKSIEFEAVNFWDPCCSPDGKQIVFRCNR
jgi:Tol biopolymer transport system component